MFRICLGLPPGSAQLLRSYVVPEIEPGYTMCKANVLPMIVSLWFYMEC